MKARYQKESVSMKESLENHKKWIVSAEQMESVLDEIEIDFAGYQTSLFDHGGTIEFYPIGKEPFNRSQLSKLRTAINKVFGKDKWKREFDTAQGVFRLVKTVESFVVNDYDYTYLTLKIIKTPLLNCRVEKEEYTATRYKAICE